MTTNDTAQIAIVAGAPGALDRAATVTLAARGATVVAVWRNEPRLHDLPGNVRREVADPTDPAAVTKRFDGSPVKSDSSCIKRLTEDSAARAVDQLLDGIGTA
jgi:NAD(P)-dependent dehydrogenase (short-subunit alcohol dehydrogenase family)